MATIQDSIRSQIISVGDVAWQEMQPGMRVKNLWTHEETKRRAILARIDPGAQLPQHRHVGDEFVFVIEGELSDEFGVITAGSMGYRPNGCVHTVACPKGATLLAVISGGIEPATERRNAPPSQVFTLSDLEWIEARPGIRQKRIWEDEAAKRRVVMARFDPGATLPPHRHVGDELIFIIEGANADEAGTVATGNMSYRPDGCAHTVASKNGATALAFVWGGIEPI